MFSCKTQKISISPIAWMILASFFFAMLGAFVKALHRLPVWEVVFARSFINLILILPWTIKNLNHYSVKDSLNPLLIRGFSGFISMAMYFYALENLRLADAVLLNYSSPISVLIISAIFLNEKINFKKIFFILIAFLGIALILKPDGKMLVNFPALIGFLSSIFAAIAYVSVKVATQNLPAPYIVLSISLIASLGSLPMMIYTFMMPTLFEFYLMLIMGVFATFAQIAMTIGYAKLEASYASTILLLTVVFSSIFGFFFFKETPDIFSFLGTILVIIGILGTNTKNYQSKK
jgi:drug/metabolite transporter (DMT)-like permease